MSARTVSLPVAVVLVAAAGAVGWVAPARGASRPATVAARTVAPLTADDVRTLLAASLDCPADVGVVLDGTVAAPAAMASPSAQVVTARCDAGAGNPPSGVYVVDRHAGLPRLVTTLVGADDDLVQPKVTLHGATVTVTALGFGSAGVARCCPDLTVVRTWQASRGALEPVSG